MTTSTMDRNAELEAFKTINLSLIASAHGYEIDRKKSTRHSVLMSNGAEKIIISQNDGHFVWCSTADTKSNGTAIDFAQRVIEPGCSLGRVRQLLRPFLSPGHVHAVQSQYAGRYAAEIKLSSTDLLGVAARYSRFETIEEPHPYLCAERGIPFELLASNRLHGRIRHCAKRGSVVFPHWGSPDENVAGADRCLVGYEIKGPGLNMFSKGGRKGLAMSAGMKGDRILAVSESMLDAISFMAIRGADQMRVASTSGQLNPSQPDLILSAINNMEEGSRVVAAFDSDRAGDTLTEKLAVIVSKSGRSDIAFQDDRPAQRESDWNKVLMDEAIRLGHIQAKGPSLDR